MRALHKRLVPALLILLLWPATAGADPVTFVASVLTAGFTQSVAATVTSFLIRTAVAVAINAVATRLMTPKIPGGADERQASVTTISLGEAPREVLFGRVCTGGSLVDAFNYGGPHGTDWECLVIALADHEIDALEGFYVGDTYYPYTGDGGQAAFADGLDLEFFNASETEGAPSRMPAPGWAPGDTLHGVARIWVAYFASPDIWPQGRPTFRFVIRGKRCYDPRKDSTAGGEGAHRWNDPSTWEWTQNAAVCRYNWVRGIYALDRVDQAEQLLIGRGLSDLEAPPAHVIAAANVCDELVDAGEGTEPRYRVGGVIRSTDPYDVVEEMFAAAMAGTIVQREGGVEVEPGQAKAVVASITDGDLITGAAVLYSDFLPLPERVNTIVARYIEPLQLWKPVSAAVLRDLDDIDADGGSREQTLNLDLVTSATQAQRCGEIERRLGRRERRATITLGPRFTWLEEGDWIAWTSSRHPDGGLVRYRVERYRIGENRQITLSLREISATVYGEADPEPVNVTPLVPLPPPDALALTDADVEAISLNADGATVPAVRGVWSTPVDPAILGVRLEVRKAGDTAIAPTTQPAPEAGVVIGTNGVGPNMTLEARLVPFGIPGRPVAPSPWTLLYTGDLVATGVSEIGGYTPAGLLAYLDGVSAQGASLTAAVLEAYLRLDEERVQLLSETFHSGRRVKRVLIDEDEMWEEGDRSLWTRVKGIAIQGEDGQSMILQKDTLIWDEAEGSTLAAHLDAVVSQIGDDIASAIEETRTWVDSESAGAQFLQQLEVSFGESWSGAITTLAQVTSDFGAAWTLALNVDGHVSGITAQNTGTASSLIFLADAIGFTNGASTVYPLTIVDGWVNAPLLRAGDIQANTITAEKIVGGAVSNLSVDTEAAADAITGSAVQVLAHTHTSEGGQHAVNVCCTVAQTGGGVSGVIAVVYCNGVEVGRGSIAFQGPFSQTIPIIGLHTPGAGSASYQVTCTQTGGSTGANVHVQTTIVVAELKK